MTGKPEDGSRTNGRVPESVKATAYDFRSPSRLSSEQIKRIDHIHTSIAKRLSVSLSGALRDYVEVDATAVRETPWAEFIKTIPSPCVTFTFSAEPLDGSGIIAIDPGLAFALVDRLFGGKGESIDTQRELTPIEQRATGKLVAATLKEIQIAWKPFVDLNVAATGFASSPDFIQGSGTNESVVIVSLLIKRSNSEGEIRVAYPHLMFEPAIRELVKHAPSARRREPDQERMTNLIQMVRMPVAVRLRPSMVSVNDLANLQVGDVLLLDNPVSEDVAVFVGDKKVFMGRPGALAGRLAIRVVKSLRGGGK
jgi:flagellar motor switch protein FliM